MDNGKKQGKQRHRKQRIEVNAWRKAKIQHRLQNWQYGEWKVKWKRETLKAEKAAAKCNG